MRVLEVLNDYTLPKFMIPFVLSQWFNFGNSIEIEECCSDVFGFDMRLINRKTTNEVKRLNKNVQITKKMKPCSCKKCVIFFEKCVIFLSYKSSSLGPGAGPLQGYQGSAGKKSKKNKKSLI